MNMAVVKSKTILTSKQEIMDYIGCSYYTFRKFVDYGLPARYENGRWVDHADNIENFFKDFSSCNVKKINDKRLKKTLSSAKISQKYIKDPSKAA